MLRVRQTILAEDDDPEKGNCFAACLASLLELPLDAVPHVMAERDWYAQTQAWLATLGLGMVEVSLQAQPPALCELPSGLLLIVSGHTDRHPSRLHAVVARTLPGGAQWEYLHDPHPAGTFLTLATLLMWLVPLDPAKAVQR